MFLLSALSPARAVFIPMSRRPGRFLTPCWQARQAFFPTPQPDMVWGYLKSELQALPLEPDHTYSVGRKLDSDLVLKVRRRSA